jgi:hypothetical protein
LRAAGALLLRRDSSEQRGSHDMTPPSSVAGVQNLCGFAYKEYGTNAHVKIHRVHMYVHSRGFDTTVHPTCSAVGCTPYIFEGIVLLYIGGHE